MTRQEFVYQVWELQLINDEYGQIQKLAERIFNNLPDIEEVSTEDYRVAKMAMHVIYSELADRYKPKGKELKLEAENLKIII